ncbi:MAG: bifunctional metallophosphatase/5'-nucleotidase [Bacteroidales bacterium]|jgi:2',3'-cyclic-nucleotide 2'-phosphodiesterase (5'-nucleotidase family)|nr:bifunctional metallophosphatase/5'-nucleotidase [Bacteroidales bacterium]
MRIKIPLIFFVASLLYGFWIMSCAPRIPDETEIVILSTTDIHGHFDNLGKFSAFVAETKSKHKNVIIADAGDRFTGNPYNDLFEKPQFPIVDLLNHIGVDVAVVGNHEFDFGIELLNERVKSSQCATIMANIEFKGSRLKGIKPYHIIEKDGIKVCFLGLTDVDKETGKPSVLAERVENLEFYDPIESATKYRHLRNESHVFVALTHIGIDNDIILADSMPELDLIIGGHSHTLLMEPLIRNNVKITQARRHAGHVGKTTITLKKGVVTKIANEMINMTTWSSDWVDSAIVKKIQKYQEMSFLDKSFAMLEFEIPSVEQLSYMVTDAALALPDVDFAVINCQGIRDDRLPAGPVTYGNIFHILPHGTHWVVVGLKPSEIRTFIESQFLQRKSCLLSPAGFIYAARQYSNGSIKVEHLTLPNGEKLDENKTYNLALDNFLFSRFLNKSANYATNTNVSVVDNVVLYLQSNPNMDYRESPARMWFH